MNPSNARTQASQGGIFIRHCTPKPDGKHVANSIIHSTLETMMQGLLLRESLARQRHDRIQTVVQKNMAKPCFLTWFSHGFSARQFLSVSGLLIAVTT